MRGENKVDVGRLDRNPYQLNEKDDAPLSKSGNKEV